MQKYTFFPKHANIFLDRIKQNGFFCVISAIKKIIMKKVLLLVAICLLTAKATAQNEKKVLKDVDQMIAQRQYLSAYQLLDNFDPNNDNIAVVLKKEHIVLNFFSQSIMHRMFSLADLKEGESLDESRQNFESGEIIVFDADSLILRLLARNPNNSDLLDGHARYHQSVLDDYDHDVWMSSLDSTCLELFQKGSDKRSATAASQLGLYYTLLEDYPSALPQYRRAISLCDTAWGDYYNIGIVEYYTEQYTEAIQHLLRAYEGYTNPALKSDAARVIGIIYDEHLNNPDKALKYFQLAISANANNVYNNAYLLKFHLTHKNYSLAETTLATGWMMAAEGGSPFEDCSLLMNLCRQYDYTVPLVDFLTKTLSKADNNFILGITDLYLGQLLENETDAISHLRSAIEHFRQEEAPDDFLNSLQELINERSSK